MKRFLAVAGNIGVGKSTLVTLLSQRLAWQPFYEPVTENPYLADFYKDMRAWAFHSQIFFLTRRLRIHRQLLDHPTSAIQDRSVYEDAEVFAHNLYRQGLFAQRDYASYRELYEVLTDFLPPPDLVIYLRASVSTLQERIKYRGRDYERQITPDYLQQLNLELYQQECQRVQARFDEAVRLAEEAFTAELAKLVSHLTERLSGQEDGKPKIFRDSIVENLTEFFQRFRQLNVRSSEQLDGLVADAQRVIRGVEPQALRDNAGLRQHVATEMSRVQSVLDGLLVDRPRRNILRRPR